MSWTITFKMPDRLFGSVNRGEAGAPLGLPSQGKIFDSATRTQGHRAGRFTDSMEAVLRLRGGVWADSMEAVSRPKGGVWADSMEAVLRPKGGVWADSMEAVIRPKGGVWADSMEAVLRPKGGVWADSMEAGASQVKTNYCYIFVKYNISLTFQTRVVSYFQMILITLNLIL